MLLMIESDFRGEIATISHRYAKDSNDYILPTSGFEWMTDDELDDWKHLSCFLELDLEYPEQLHDLQNDYPLAPERIKIGNVEKLIQNLNKQTSYVMHYENLKFYESLGLEITKIHRGIKFEQSARQE